MIRRILVATMWGLGTWCLSVSLRMLGAKIGRIVFATRRDVVNFEPGMVMTVDHGQGSVDVVDSEPNRSLN